MKNLLGLALLLSLLLNVVLLLHARREIPPPPPVVRTQVVEKTIELEPRPAPTAVVPPPVVVAGPPPPSAPAMALQVTLAATPAGVGPGGMITVLCTVLSGAPMPKHWIGMVEPDALVTSYLDYRMVSASVATYVFKAPNKPCDVEFRYVLEDDRTVVATSNAVRIHGAPPARPLVDLQPGSTIVRCGGEIQARWSVYSGGRSAKDWIGLFAPGAKNDDFAGWAYITDADQGAVTIKAPEEPGPYELRYLLDNGYESVAVSVRITVVP